MAISSLNIGNNESNNNEEEEEENTITMICAACGKEGDGDSMNMCNKCDLVKYCNAACKKKHKSKHKKKCERRVAELYDEQLFQEHPPREDCPICMLQLPLDGNQITFEPCCGKDICNGCIIAMFESEGDDSLCAFCRTPDTISDEEIIERLEKRMDKGNAVAFSMLAGFYAEGDMGLPQDWLKANELYLKAGELGCDEAYFNLGNAYDDGEGVDIDEEKAKHYWELAAMMGNVLARNNLGCMEGQTGNPHRAMKHFLISARAGHEKSLDTIKSGFRSGIVTKDGHTKRVKMK